MRDQILTATKRGQAEEEDSEPQTVKSSHTSLRDFPGARISAYTGFSARSATTSRDAKHLRGSKPIRSQIAAELCDWASSKHDLEDAHEKLFWREDREQERQEGSHCGRGQTGDVLESEGARTHVAYHGIA